MDKVQLFKISGRAAGIGLLFIVLALVLAWLSLSVPVSPHSDPTEIHLRNISSVIAYLALGLYLLRVSSYNQYGMKKLDFSIVLLIIASAVKITVSTIYFILQISTTSILTAYYAGEILLWTAVILFAVHLRKLIRQNAMAKDDTYEGNFEEFYNDLEKS